MHARTGRRRTFRLVGLVLVAAMIAAACGGGGSSEQFDAASRDPNTDIARAYGLGPQPNDDVTLQPDVVVVSGAGNSIRSVQDGGLTWVVDGAAGRVGDLAPGKIMFVTGRSVGRVLAINDDGNDKKVTIGPVTLTDVIRDGTFRNTDITLDDPIEYPGIEPNWETSDDATTPTTAETRAARSRELDAVLAGRTMAGGGTATATCCSSGIGAHFSYNQGLTKIFGNVELTFARPKAGFYLSITGGRVTRAELQVKGGIGARVDFRAGLDQGSRDIKVPFPLGGEFAFPIAQVLGVPLTFTISQGVTVTTAFGAKVGTIKGDGAFELAGSLGYGWAGGTFGNQSEVKFKRTSSLLNSLSGVPVGVMGLLVQHRVRFNVGFSAYVLKAGVYIDVETAIGITRGSALGAFGTLGTHFVECQGVGLGFAAKFGVGYSILEPVTNAINRFLSLIDVKPISASGGFASKPVQLYSNEEVIPDVELCGHTPGRGGAGGGGSGGGSGTGAASSGRQ
jgi:hypothetical protein